MGRVKWVEIRDVTVRFRSVLALRGITWRFTAGRPTVVLGPNGSGKSTLLRVLGTALAPTGGTVWYEPLGELRGGGVGIRREIGWVGHELRCYLDLSARENVELAGRLRGVNGEEAWMRAADRLGLGALSGRAVRTLSRGQQQRVAVACALVHGPSVLLLDEAWSGLDGRSAGLLEDWVCMEAEAGAVVVAVTHSESLADRLGAVRVRMERGRWAE